MTSLAKRTTRGPVTISQLFTDDLRKQENRGNAQSVVSSVYSNIVKREDTQYSETPQQVRTGRRNDSWYKLVYFLHLLHNYQI